MQQEWIQFLRRICSQETFLTIYHGFLQEINIYTCTYSNSALFPTVEIIAQAWGLLNTHE